MGCRASEVGRRKEEKDEPALACRGRCECGRAVCERRGRRKGGRQAGRKSELNIGGSNTRYFLPPRRCDAFGGACGRFRSSADRLNGRRATPSQVRVALASPAPQVQKPRWRGSSSVGCLFRGSFRARLASRRWARRASQVGGPRSKQAAVSKFRSLRRWSPRPASSSGGRLNLRTRNGHLDAPTRSTRDAGWGGWQITRKIK
jgi:hypothetical protein